MSNVRYQVTLTFYAYDEDNNVCLTEEQEFCFASEYSDRAGVKYESLRKYMCKRMADEDVFTSADVRLVDRDGWETIKSSAVC